MAGGAPLSPDLPLTNGVVNATMATVRFVSEFAAAFERRRAANKRYSLRAFARGIGISHSAAGRILKGTQQPSDATIIQAGTRLGWDAARVSCLLREERVRRLQSLALSPAFTADARWIASRANLPLDEVQIALHEALRTGRIAMTTPHTWKVNA